MLKNKDGIHQFKMLLRFTCYGNIDKNNNLPHPKFFNTNCGVCPRFNIFLLDTYAPLLNIDVSTWKTVSGQLYQTIIL